MLGTLSHLSNKNPLLQKKRVFWGSVLCSQRLIQSHFKIVKLKSVPNFCNPRLSFTNKLSNFRVHSRNMCKMKINYGINFIPLMPKIFCSKDLKMDTNESINWECYVLLPLKIDESFSFSDVEIISLLSSQSDLCLKNNSTSNKAFGKVNAIPLHEQNLFKKKVTSPILYEVIGPSNNIKRSFSTATTSDDLKISSDSNGLLTLNTEKIYVAPKNVLHNAYNIIAQELKNEDFKLQPTYSMVKGRQKNHSWSCTYSIKWPEPKKFLGVGQTKQEASHKAAIATLLWLRKNEKITKEGSPIIVGKNELKEIVNKTQPTLSLDIYTTDQMKAIADTYRNEFVPLLTKNFDAKSKHTLNVDDGNLEINADNLNVKQKLLNSAKYFSREKISLPISQYKEQFLDLLRDNNIVIIKGEPGCGKSTRIPQYVLELWAREGLKKQEPCQIAVTQPRRIAAISLADRVSDERNEQCGHIVGYQIRLKSNYNPVTGRILYCTTGILLKYLQSDINLSNFTYIILDEAHERDVNTDLLMNLLRSALTINPKLKLIIMSATVDIALFKRYFNDPPVLHIPGFTYPVKSYFLDDLSELNLNKSLKMCSNNNEIRNVVHEDVVKVIQHIHKTKEEGAILCFLPGWEDIMKVEKLIPPSNDLTVLCLHSRLQDSDQRKIFSKTPPGIRKVILSTNIAETSITIDDVVYVIDTGIHKENRFDNDKDIACIDNYWISQSSMAQRKGRAGRVRPGESFHLYTKLKYEEFSKYTDPEILKTSLTKIVLNSKVYSNNMDALEFMSQLPSPPEKNSTRRAVKELKELKLLDENENLTSLGRTLANFQLEPKLAKILVNSVVYKCVTPVVDIVTIFSADTELFGSGLVNKEGIKKIKSQGSKHSDHLAMMRLFEAWLELMEEHDVETAKNYCSDANLLHHKLITLSKLRKIHFDYLRNGLHETLPIADNFSDNDELVKAVLFSGAGNLLRRREWDIVKGRYKKGDFLLTNHNQKASITSESVNFKKLSPTSKFLIYFNEVRSNIRRTTLIRESSVISPVAMLLFSDKDLAIKEVEGDSDNVILGLKNTGIEFSCSKGTALQIQKCKEVLDSVYQYFIFQMTEGGECNTQINQTWDKILGKVNLILLKHSIK